MKNEAYITRGKNRIANAVFFFISGFGYAAWASRIPTIRTTFQLSDSMLGTLLFAMPVGLICTLPLTNYLLGKFSSRKIMLLGSVAFNSVLCFTGFASQIWQLFIILFCFGSARNLLNISMNAQAVSVQRHYTESIITTFHGIWSIAGFAGAALGYFLVSMDIGIKWHFPLVGLTMIALTIYQYQYTIDDPPEPKKRKTLFSLPEKSVLHYAIIVFICMACENTMYDWSGVYFQKTMYASQAMATGAFAVYMVAMTLGRFAGDRVVNRIGIKNMLYYNSILLTAGFLLVVLIPYPIFGFIGFLMTGFGISCISPLVLSLAGKSAKEGSARTLASISSISYLGFLVVPPIIGFISEAASIRISFGIITLLAVIMIVLIKRIKQDSKTVTEHTQEVAL
ncbi:MFS transporter [Flavobacterium pectinovorum]|uniref:MFS transporter n=2 Tax=Flavobacterium pectinovorum TaxID=29533 RepID=A0A502EBS7_9FLAO|nr:MFS transporter [Flavobacterium pectinovorum]